MLGSIVDKRDRLQFKRGALLFVVGVLFALGAGYLIIMEEVRLAFAIMAALVLVAIATRSIPAAITGGLVYLVVLADLRRMLISIEDWSSVDPLIMVGTLLAALLFGYAWSANKVKVDTPLAKLVLLLMGIMILQVFNPRQGGLIVGVAGALFLITPLLWFWIGRTYATPAFMRGLFFKTFMVLAVLAAAMGLYQTYYDYLPYQQIWYDVAGYVALGSPGIQAPVSVFASSTEYSIFLGITVVILWAVLLIKGKRALPALIPLAVFFVAIFLTGSRGPILFLLITGAGMWAVLSKNTTMWIPRGLVALVIGIVGLLLVLPQLEGVGEGHDRLEHRIQRQTEEVGAIGEGGGSTMVHLELILGGYVRSVREPLGLGLGAMTRAADAFGDRAFGGTEVDLTDVAVSLGLPGGLVYHLIAFFIFLTAVRYWLRTRNVIALCFLGILAFTFFGWLRGGRYAASAIIWFCIGAMDGLNRKEEKKAAEEEPILVSADS